MRLLFDKGADVNALGGKCSSALQAASFGGHETAMRLVLDEGADVNALGGKCSSALQAASFGGHETAMRLVLDEGADVNALGESTAVLSKQHLLEGTKPQCDWCLTREQMLMPWGESTALSDKIQFLQLLMDVGANVNLVGGLGKHGTATQAACYQGGMVGALGGEYGSALQAASRDSEGSKGVARSRS